MAANPYLAPNSSTGVPTSTVPSVTSTANAIVALDSTGRLDPSVMPVGIAPPTISLPQTGSLADGDSVNIYNNSGTATCRKADASAVGKPVRGFVLAATSSPGPALVYLPGDENTHKTGLTPGADYYSDPATPGGVTATIPSTSGTVVEYVGTAVSATELSFNPELRYVN